MNIVDHESCVRCGQAQEFSASSGGWFKHNIDDCIGFLLSKIEDLSSRVDELETKESAREFSEHGPKW
jgi:hypothetical protein